MIFQQGHLLALKGEEEGGGRCTINLTEHIPTLCSLPLNEHRKTASGASVICARQCSARIQQRWWGNIINWGGSGFLGFPADWAIVPLEDPSPAGPSQYFAPSSLSSANILPNKRCLRRPSIIGQMWVSISTSIQCGRRKYYPCNSHLMTFLNKELRSEIL